MKKDSILVAVPCYNEEAVLTQFIETFDGIYMELRTDYDLTLLFVDDGSEDSTVEIIKKASEKYQYIRFIQLAKNVGHQSALRAAFDVSEGYSAVITLDADLQHPPSYIPTMIEEWQESGANIVQMLRRDSSKTAGTVKYYTSKLYYKIINYLSGLKIEYGASDFRLIDEKIASEVAKSPEKHLFLRGYFSWVPAKRVSIQYKPSQRVAGSSKYTFKKMLTLAKEGVLQFSEKPLRLVINLGVWIAILSFVYGIYLIVAHFFGTASVSGWASIMVLILFCFGINFILIGLVGRYLTHSISIQKKRPEYIIAQNTLLTKN